VKLSKAKVQKRAKLIAKTSMSADWIWGVKPYKRSRPIMPVSTRHVKFACKPFRLAFLFSLLIPTSLLILYRFSLDRCMKTGLSPSPGRLIFPAMPAGKMTWKGSACSGMRTRPRPLRSVCPCLRSLLTAGQGILTT
jgi:hypothetical protein